jgi:hypothetical protein
MFRNWLSKFQLTSATQTCLVSNDKIKRGYLPDESFSFLASIILKHNGNYDRKFINHIEFYLNTPEKPSQ